jgi:elongator complex protein 2
VTLGRTGSWRRWEYDEDADMWSPGIAVTGHTKAVNGISWSQDGRYLLSTSADQTTRLHARWRNSGDGSTWHEMSRPQIHGYDLNCIDTLGNDRFVSGADEKLMRVFRQPRAVAKLLSRLGSIRSSNSSAEDAALVEDAVANAEDMPDAANMPLLGLSNKAIDAIDDDEEVGPPTGNDRDAVDPASVVRKSVLEIDHPPLEENLSRHTLWPEVEKLYGHGYEISCLAASHDGGIIASACKASSTNHAVIRLCETAGWTEVKPPLTAHSLTATRLRFSADDRYLLSVGRDRQWAVFERAEGEHGVTFRLLQSNPKGHTRMILDAAWAPPTTVATEETRIFATAGRDKKVNIWAAKRTTATAVGGQVDSFELACSLTEDKPVTAVDFLGRLDGDGKLVLATGTESGKISIWTMGPDTVAKPSTFVLEPRCVCLKDDTDDCCFPP